jgi:hypothetical protein
LGHEDADRAIPDITPGAAHGQKVIRGGRDLGGNIDGRRQNLALDLRQNFGFPGQALHLPDAQPE